MIHGLILGIKKAEAQMKVILNSDIKGVGRAGQTVDVSEGYARNFLFPTKKAVAAAGGNAAAIKQKQDSEEKKRKSEELGAKENAAKTNNAHLVIKKKSSADGKLFGSVAEADVAEGLTKMGFVAEKSNIIMEKHIKEPGTYNVTVRYKHGNDAKIKVTVEREG